MGSGVGCFAGTGKAPDSPGPMARAPGGTGPGRRHEKAGQASSRRLLIATLERIPPQLEPPEPPTPPEKVEPERVEPERVEPERVVPERVVPERVVPERVEPERVEPTPSEPTGGPREEGTERRSWWREFFGFGE